MAPEKKPLIEYHSDYDASSLDLENMLYARHAEVESLKDLTAERGTSIPSLFNQCYKFIQNPSSVSVETFKRMVDTDDTVGSGVDFLTTCLAARLGRYQHKSKEITKWVNDRLEEVEGGWTNVVKEILSASWAGYYVGEKVWANTDNGFVPERIISLPPSTVLFETDRTGSLTDDGILQYQRNWNPMMMAQGMGLFGGVVGSGSGFANNAIRPDMFARFGDLPFPMRTANSFNYLSIRIPRAKCIHYSFDAQGKFGNPYGRSLLRRAYKFYVMKDAFLQMMAIALDRKGTPLTIIYADPNTTILDPNQTQADNRNQPNQRGQRVGMRADQAAKEAFKNVHNDTTIILPGKKDQIFSHDVIEQASNSGDFIAAVQMCDKGLLRSLLLPSLIFGNGDGSGSFALGQEHAKTFDKICDGMLSGAKHVLLQQLVQEMVAYNFPKSAWQKDGLGTFSKRELSTDEKQKEAEMFKTGVDMGAIDMDDLNDLNKIREGMGFEERETPIAPKASDNPFGDPGMGAEGDAENPFTKRGGHGKDSNFKPEENLQ